jgi:hypothetical protein
MQQFVYAVAVTVVLSATAWAGPKDATQETLIDPSSIEGNGVTWDNRTVQTKVKAGKCKLQIQFKGTLPAIEGQTLICLASADVRASALPIGLIGNSVVLTGTVESGKLKMSANLAAIGCGVLSSAINVNGNTICYEEDPSYDPAAACAGAGMLWVPPSAGFKPDSLAGLCQGFVDGAGERIPPPSSPKLAEQGAYQPLQ